MQKYWFRAAEEGDTSIILRQTKYCRQLNDQGESALMVCARLGTPQHLKCANALIPLEKGLQTKQGVTALMIAIYNNNEEIVQGIAQFEKGLRLSQQQFGCPPGALAIHIAAACNRPHLVKILYKYEGQLAGIDQNIVKILHQQNISFDQQTILKLDAIQRTPLHYAVFAQNYQIIQNIQQFSGMQDKLGLTALMHAVLLNDIQFVKLIQIHCKKELKIQSKKLYKNLAKGFTALMLACALQNYECALLLCKDEIGLQTETGQLAIQFCNSQSKQATTVKNQLIKELEIRKKQGNPLETQLLEEMLLNDSFDQQLSEIEKIDENDAQLADSQILREQEQERINKEIEAFSKNKDVNAQLNKLAEILNIGQINQIHDAIQDKKSQMATYQDEIKNYDQQLEEIEPQIQQFDKIIEEKKQACQELQQKIDDIKKITNDLMGEFKIDAFTTMRETDTVECFTQTDIIDQIDKEQQKPSYQENELKDASTLIKGDIEVGEIYLKIMQQTQQLMKQRHDDVTLIQKQLKKEKTNFLKSLKYINRQFDVNKKELEYEIQNNFNKQQDELQQQAQQNPFINQVVSQIDEKMIDSQQIINKKKAVISLVDYQKILDENEQLKHEIQHTQNVNFDIQTSICNITGKNINDYYQQQ